ncbi:hypothetical protein MTBSS4_120081 [Magnetospirillum sp. SS-4]|nr:hypothetical protein MTBSS4_120081 [Magnetospirillum sp. SS-4]
MRHKATITDRSLVPPDAQRPPSRPHVRRRTSRRGGGHLGLWSDPPESAEVEAFIC